MILHLHSVVDLITNSSTEIYSDVNGNSVKVVKKIVNAVLDAADSDKDFDDLFDIKIIPSERAIEIAADNYMGEHKIAWNNKKYKEIQKQIENGEIECNFDGVGGTALAITAKPGIRLTEDIASLLGSIFEVEARFDG